MFNIGEFARLGGVSIRTLRHYDEIGLLPPAKVDPATGYRAYSPVQLQQLNRIVALKDLGLSLTQIRHLLDGITVNEMYGMLVLRRAQLEEQLETCRNHLLGVEARLSYLERENDMPADDMVVKKIPEMTVVAIAGAAPAGGGPRQVVPVVNRALDQFDQSGIRESVGATGQDLIFYDLGDSKSDMTVYTGFPVAGRSGELPEPMRYLMLPAIEAVTAVRGGPAAAIFPMVYQDVYGWVREHGLRASGQPRDVFVHQIDDVSQADEQVFETQLPFVR